MAIAADIEAQVSLMGPRFQFQFLRASEALTAIAAQPRHRAHGRLGARRGR